MLLACPQRPRTGGGYFAAQLVRALRDELRLRSAQIPAVAGAEGNRGGRVPDCQGEVARPEVGCALRSGRRGGRWQVGAAWREGKANISVRL